MLFTPKPPTAQYFVKIVTLSNKKINNVLKQFFLIILSSGKKLEIKYVKLNFSYENYNKCVWCNTTP
jgi:hypothetical protein